ncbi:MAG: SMP-30/gluconolactonase/LRE family protein [Candidatus Methylacidiphilales bacterium]|nr:SMP-30/gluconolactonase/LRE family protein [Candidatus Methylacidiphilales bacterium]
MSVTPADAADTNAAPVAPAAPRISPGVEKLAEGYKFVEGPIWIAANPATGTTGYLLFSDIPGNTIYKWDPATKTATPWRKPSNGSNGLTLDSKGRLLACHHETRVVTRSSAQDPTTPLEVIAEQFNGARFHSPNDIVVAADGAIWFTDPVYGRGKRPSEQPVQGVYRLDPETKEIRLIIGDFEQPNGLCFSPDGAWIYIGDSGKPAHVRRLKVNADHTLSDSTIFYKVKEGVPDGFKTDASGTLYITVGNGVAVVKADGTEDRIILVPECPANCGFGGDDGKTLFMTARHSLYSIRIP